MLSKGDSKALQERNASQVCRCIPYVVITRNVLQDSCSGQAPAAWCPGL